MVTRAQGLVQLGSRRHCSWRAVCSDLQQACNVLSQIGAGLYCLNLDRVMNASTFVRPGLTLSRVFRKGIFSSSAVILMENMSLDGGIHLQRLKALFAL